MLLYGGKGGEKFSINQNGIKIKKNRIIASFVMKYVFIERKFNYLHIKN